LQQEIDRLQKKQSPERQNLAKKPPINLDQSIGKNNNNEITKALTIKGKIEAENNVLQQEIDRL